MIKTQIGEYVVGAYLKRHFGCDVVDYNVRPPTGGLAGLAEFDVLGLRFNDSVAMLCEVTTHLDGLNYKSNEGTVRRVREKHERQRAYAKKHLAHFDKVRFMFWSPVVPRGYLTTELAKITTLELVINEKYKECVDFLRQEARDTTRDLGNPFLRSLQILEHLRS